MTPPNIGGITGPQIRPGLPDAQQPRVDGAPQQQGKSLSTIPNGTVVNGTVLEAREAGAYLVRVAGQTLTAQANLPLLVGQHFRAVWDSSGDIPVLRLSDAEQALLGKLSSGDKEVASALIARGLSLDPKALASIRAAWNGMGQQPGQLAPLAELWARGLPMTSANVQVLSWYLSLDEQKTSSLWKRTRDELRERLARGDDPRKALRSLLGKDDDIAAFLRGHGLLSSPSREGVDPSLLAGAFLPAGDDAQPLNARIATSAFKRGEKSFWSVSFEMEGDRLGLVAGDVETDGRSLSVVLKAEQEASFEELRRRRHILRHELEEIPLSLQNVAVAHGRRMPRVPGRGLDITV
ncbi:MAG TPA: hypothetical protein PK849_08700 [Synergistales bacterium]|nr:hypothetical protein [Synergistales bacterium]